MVALKRKYRKNFFTQISWFDCHYEIMYGANIYSWEAKVIKIPFKAIKFTFTKLFPFLDEHLEKPAFPCKFCPCRNIFIYVQLCDRTSVKNVR